MSSSTTHVRVDVLAGFRDPRGLVFEPLPAAELAGYRNVHVVVSVPGAIRGNHRHLHGREITSVVGPMLVRVRENGAVRDMTVPAGEVWRFEFAAGVAHAFKNTGTEATVLASFNTEEHDPAHPDVERDVLIEA
jgi:dTDP-4-dehydrorhamnose 3,5-epimerase-like enzyme